jgi:hypothetical protein
MQSRNGAILTILASIFVPANFVTVSPPVKQGYTTLSRDHITDKSYAVLLQHETYRTKQLLCQYHVTW